MNHEKHRLEPYQPFFAAGSLFAVLAMGMWLLHLAGIRPYSWQASQAGMHMVQMVYFFYPFFFFGFLLTVFPRLLSRPLPARPVVLMQFLLYFMAAILYSTGLYLDGAWIHLAGLPAFLAHAWIVSNLWRLLSGSSYRHKEMPFFMWLGVALGLPGSFFLVLFCYSGAEQWRLPAEAIGIYGFLLPTVYAVAYRMVPVFTAVHGQDVVRVRYGLHWFFACSLGRMLLMLAGAREWCWIMDAALFLVVFRQLGQWRIWRRKPDLLRAVLHWSMLWFPLAFALLTVSDFVEWWSGEIWLSLRQAALHALLVGGFGSLLLGMATRITLGGQRQRMAADRLTSILFIAFQGVAGLRVLSGMLSESWPWFIHGIELSAIGWMIVFLLWIKRYGFFLHT